MKLDAYFELIKEKPCKWASRHGISLATISRARRGGHNLMLSTARQIVEATKGAVSLDDLYDGDNGGEKQSKN